MSVSTVNMAGLGNVAVAAPAGKQRRQMMVALPSFAFSRIHHSVLVNRGSGVSSFAVRGTATSAGTL
jgi:hypothetical protein